MLIVGCGTLVGIIGLISLNQAVSADKGNSRGSSGAILATTPDAYFQPGTQPLGDGADALAPFISAASECVTCHGNYAPEVPAYDTWVNSMMGQSARDPLFHASLSVANQDADGAGAYCIRCHAPVAFLEGRHDPPDMSAFEPIDFEGITCTVCHRMVNPNYEQGVSPSEDVSILASLDAADLLPIEPGNANFVVDPVDNRRGPHDDYPFNFHIGDPQPEMIKSPFHQQAEFCWTCHEVSNPLLVRDEENNRYVLGDLDQPHPTNDQFDMFPIHRTYSEWKNSYYSTIGVDHGDRFGGDHPTGVMRSCQDCHMPKAAGYACNIQVLHRPHIGQHSFAGANTWVMRAVRSLYPDSETGLSEQLVEDAIARNIDMLERAGDLFVSSPSPCDLKVRIINRTGHKLPTGFPDGRRMWINVKYLNSSDVVVQEYGGYDFDEALLDESSTKVYEAILGIDEEQSLATGLPEGPTFHFMLANSVVKDNRIPPAGWFKSIAEQFQTMPVGAEYANGQHWDDTFFDVPLTADRAVVTIYYQVTSRGFIEFLSETDQSKEGFGQIALDQWELHGRSQPVVMNMMEIQLSSPADLTGSGSVGLSDLLELLNNWGACPAGDCTGDLNCDGVVNLADLLLLINSWGSL